MSAQVSQVLGAVRGHLHDRNMESPVFDDPDILLAINANLTQLGSDLLMGEEWVAAAVTTSNATDTYALPGSQQYEQVLEFRNTTNGMPLRLVSPAEFARVRLGVAQVSKVSGVPAWGCLIENASQALSVQFFPWPASAFVFDMRRALTPGRVSGFSATLPFDQHGIEALGYAVAAQLAGTSTPERLAPLGITPGSAGLFLSQRAAAVKAALNRRAMMEKSGRSRRGRNW